MSEVNNNTPSSIDDGIPEVSFEVEVSNVVQAPIDDTLSISGEAADAKATGDAIAAAKAETEAKLSAVAARPRSAQSTFPHPRPRQRSAVLIGYGRKS